MNFALLYLMGVVSLPFDLGAKLESSGVEQGSIVKLECLVPENMCKDFVMQLYKKGYGVSKEEGMYNVVLGPLKRSDEGKLIVLYKIADKEDSAVIEMENQNFEFKQENSSRKGILSALLFILAGYLLFFVIR